MTSIVANKTATNNVCPAPVRLLELVLPVPPSSNHYWRYTRTGVYKTTEALMYERYVGIIINRLAPSKELMPPERAIYQQEFTIYINQSHINRLDWTNHVKLLEDAIFRTLGINDSWVRKVSVIKQFTQPDLPNGLALDGWDQCQAGGEFVHYILEWSGEVDKRKTKSKAESSEAEAGAKGSDSEAEGANGTKTNKKTKTKKSPVTPGSLG